MPASPQRKGGPREEGGDNHKLDQTEQHPYFLGLSIDWASYASSAHKGRRTRLLYLAQRTQSCSSVPSSNAEDNSAVQAERKVCGLDENTPPPHLTDVLECLVTRKQNCLGRIRRCGLGGDVSMWVGLCGCKKSAAGSPPPLSLLSLTVTLNQDVKLSATSPCWPPHFPPC